MGHSFSDQVTSLLQTFKSHIPKQTALHRDDWILAKERVCAMGRGAAQPQKALAGQLRKAVQGVMTLTLAGSKASGSSRPGKHTRFPHNLECIWTTSLDFMLLTLILPFTFFSTPNSHFSVAIESGFGSPVTDELTTQICVPSLVFICLVTGAVYVVDTLRPFRFSTCLSFPSLIISTITSGLWVNPVSGPPQPPAQTPKSTSHIRTTRSRKKCQSSS